MGKDKADRLLGEAVKGRSLWDDVPEERVVLLNLRFLAGPVGIAEEEGGLPIPGKAVLKCEDVGEFAAIVGEDEREQAAEPEPGNRE